MEIPDLSGRPDEIGRLSSALRAMVTALYDRIDANERFATDVAHEIKKPTGIFTVSCRHYGDCQTGFAASRTS